ncbi:MAG: hypothetical protein E6J14_02670 [Chloroflexi bacterium]|nr:MAG: hypothetical protein E6J14_02670 [Chloroflexota bacterium]
MTASIATARRASAPGSLAGVAGLPGRLAALGAVEGRAAGRRGALTAKRYLKRMKGDVEAIT